MLEAPCEEKAKKAAKEQVDCGFAKRRLVYGVGENTASECPLENRDYRYSEKLRSGRYHLAEQLHSFYTCVFLVLDDGKVQPKCLQGVACDITKSKPIFVCTLED